MNTVASFLTENWQRLGLQKFGQPDSLATVIVTPRFRASAHLLFFVLSNERRAPFLVVKVPRIAGDNRRLDREAENLQRIQASRAGGFDSIPRLLAYEDYCENRVLVQTALPNQPMKPAIVRKQGEICTLKVVRWLIDVHRATLTNNAWSARTFETLVTEHLDYFERVFPCTKMEMDRLEQTRKITSNLVDRELPVVFEHGDLSSPNILMSDAKEVGVVDWELAEPQGLPAVDLFFFLSYVAFARTQARKNAQYLAAFKSAFFGPRAWAIPHIVNYRETLELSPKILRPLFVLCWSRYAVSLVARLQEHSGSETLSATEADWLRSNRYYALWQCAVEHLDEIAFA